MFPNEEQETTLKKPNETRDFHGDTVDKNLPASVETQSAILVLEDSTCCGYLNLGKTTTEPKATPTEGCVPRACALQQEKTAQRESVHCNQKVPLSTIRESPCVATKTQCN